MSSPNVERRVTERNTEPDGDKTAEEDNRNDHQDTLDFSDEYEQWKSQTGEVLGHVDRLRQTLDDRTLQVRSESFQTLFEDCDGVEAMRSELVRVWKTLRATQTFVDEDFGSSMEALRLSLAAYSEATLERLNNERKELAEGNADEDQVPASTTGSRGTARASAMHEKVCRIIVELKQLELLAAEVEESATSPLLSAAAADGDAAQRNLDAAQRHAQVCRQETETQQLRLSEEQAAVDREETERRDREDRQRREVAEEERREAEEQRRLEDDERLRKEDPKHWPTIVYELEGADDLVGSGIGCVVRTDPDSAALRSDQLECRAVNWQQNRYKLAGHEEQVSAMICLRPANYARVVFDSTVWVAVPYSDVSRSRETSIRLQRLNGPHDEKHDEQKPEVGKPEPEMEADDKSASVSPVAESDWEDVLTRDTTVDGQEWTRFVEMPLSDLGESGINIVVLSRPKRDVDKWNSRGGRLVSSVDQRISVSAPRNAFRLTTDVSLQVLAVDSVTLSGLKERYDSCDHLLGSSTLLLMSLSNAPQKPLTLTVTNPAGGGKKSKSAGASLPRPAASTWTAGRGNRPASQSFGYYEDVFDDVIQLLVKDGAGRWRHLSNVKMIQQREFVQFQLNQQAQSIVLLRTGRGLQSPDLCRIACDLESSLNERPSQLVVRQHADDASVVYVECCRRDAVDKLLEGRLATANYTAGRDPGPLVVLREGDVLELSMRGNVQVTTADDQSPNTATDERAWSRRFVYNSNLSSLSAELNVREVDSFAQHAVDCYHGYVRLCLVERPYQPPPRLTAVRQQTVSNNRKSAAALGGKAVAAATDGNLVCEVLLSLPKPPKNVLQITRMETQIKGPEPLSVEYFDQLSAGISEDWIRLADKLKLGRAAIQRISQSNAHHNNTAAAERYRRCARDALVQWFRSSAKSHDRVEELRLALVAAGRNDLAEQLNARYHELHAETHKKLREEPVRKSIQAYTENIAAARAWRQVGKSLGVSAEDLSEIGGPGGTPGKASAASTRHKDDHQQVREQARRMLEKWRETNGDNACIEQLLSAVKKLRLNDVAASISVIS